MELYLDINLAFNSKMSNKQYVGSTLYTKCHVLSTTGVQLAILPFIN